MEYRFRISFRASIDLFVRFYVCGRSKHMSKDVLAGLKIFIVHTVQVAGSETVC